MSLDQLNSRLEGHLRDLHLPTIRECYEGEAVRATQESFGYEQYLFELVQREIAERRERRIARFLRESRLPLEKNMSTLDMNRMPKKARLQVKALLDGGFLKRCENVLAFGNPGSGKTHLLCAIGQELIQQGHRVLFIQCSLLVQELLVAKRELRIASKLKRLGNYAAIIIDDIGYVQQSRGYPEFS
ncbi:MAG: ATP-binding protein [Candidatus Eisenbacteria bacterium]|uniref:ATP-binding protein n=1 Tax=Eiseniibacteriota bacterium TaxID=2212470 RepID=A0A948W5P3_UNCEI|nr:ATP-binding protein [Candidatus Eisenbacteria bacterium]MBU2690220.1 ATP-binding protein [Candidatus Eisenbacteria bacterium]